MGYRLSILLSFSELLALDAALQHERLRLADELHLYAGHDDIVGSILHDSRAITKMIDALDDVITQEADK